MTGTEMAKMLETQGDMELEGWVFTSGFEDKNEDDVAFCVNASTPTEAGKTRVSVRYWGCSHTEALRGLLKTMEGGDPEAEGK